MSALKLYTDTRFLPEGVRPAEILFPFLGLFREPLEWADQNRFASYMTAAASFFERVEDIAAADVAVLPSDWKRYARAGNEAQARAFVESVSASGKPIVVMYAVDETDPVPLPNTVVLRTSFDRSTRRRGEYCLPGFVGDMIANYRGGVPDIRQKSDRALVGFCGFAMPELQGWLRMRSAIGRMLTGKRSTKPNWVAFRHTLLERLHSNTALDTRFLLRDAFMAGAMDDAARRASARHEYADNMLNSDYTLCMRGGGNYSFRFYETLSAGRIPIFIDTDSPLTYPDQIDWSQHLVRVNQGEVDHIGEIVADFHASLTPARFIEMQHANRALWESWLSPHGYFSKLHHTIDHAMRTKDLTAL